MSRRTPVNRSSIANARQRRTTVNQGKNITEILDSEDFQNELLEVNNQQEKEVSVKENPTFQQEIIKEDLKEDEEDQKDNDDQPFFVKNNPKKAVMSSFALTTQSESVIENFFDDELRRNRRVSSKRQSMQNNSKRTVRTRRKVDLDILQELKDVESLDEEIQKEGGPIIQDIDDLLKEAEVINIERQESIGNTENDTLDLQIPLIKTPKAGDSTGRNAQGKSRFSVLIEDENLRDQITSSFTVKYQKGRPIPVEKELELSSHDRSRDDKSRDEFKSRESRDERSSRYSASKKSIKSNDDSMDTEEDIENYLEELESNFIKMSNKDIIEEEQHNHQRSPQKRKQSSRNNILGWLNQLIGKDYVPSYERKKSVFLSQCQVDFANLSGKSPNQEEDDDDDNDDYNWDSDDSICKEFYMNIHQEVILKTKSEERKRKIQRYMQFSKEDWEYKDPIKIIDWYEKKYQEEAQEKVKNFQLLNPSIQKQANNNNIKATAIAICDKYIIVGNQKGDVNFYLRDCEDAYQTFSEKDFNGLAVTAIDVHQLRMEYVLLGYQKGQIVILKSDDPKKPLKIIKDHHDQPITNIRFCNYTDRKQVQQDQKQEGPQEAEDLEAWMFVSIDISGKIVINTISKMLFILRATKVIVQDPIKNPSPKYTNIVARFSQQYILFIIYSSKIHDQGICDDMAIVAIGSKDQVIIAEVTNNKLNELHTIPCPKQYYNPNTKKIEEFTAPEPQLSWGYGMSPLLRDRPHSLLAIAWGPLIQIVVFIDNEETDNPFILDGFYILREEKQTSKTKKDKVRKSVRFDQDYDNQLLKTLQDIQTKRTSKTPLAFDIKDSETKAFTIPELFIEQIMFISDSVLLVLTKGQEVRILYTQSFNPESYQPEKPTNKTFKKKLAKTEHPAIESGLLLQNIYQSEHIKNYSQSIKVHDVFSRSLSFYRGKIKGFGGIPDNEYQRQKVIRAGLKQLVKDIISDAIEVAKKDTIVSNRKATTKYLKEMTDVATTSKLENFTRVVIEFCIQLKNSDFLFQELFQVFKDQRVEDVLISELEPFILSGTVYQWDIPHEIIKSQIIQYYKDLQKYDTLERVLVNLNLSKYPKTLVLELVHLSEQLCFTNAILYLYTHLFDKKDEKNNANKKIDIKILRDQQKDQEEFKELEKTTHFLGYKILWIIKMFLNGKKYPSGNFRERKWRTYIHDIVQFICNPKILTTLLFVDAEAFFQVIAILFYPSKPYELLVIGREDKNIPTIQHAEIVKIIDSYCLSFEAGQNIKAQYLFFAANVVSKSPITGLDSTYFYNIARELMSINKKYLEFSKGLQEMSQKRKKFIHKMLASQGIQSPFLLNIDINQYLGKTESDYINLIKKSEPLDSIQLSDLLRLAEQTQFNQVKIFLLDKKDEYIKCLQMLISDFGLIEALSAEEQAEKILQWIKHKINVLEERAPRSIIDRNICDQFKREVAQSIKKLVSIDPVETVVLIEEKFNGNHKEMIDSLNRDPIEQMYYLNAFIDKYDKQIEETITNYGLNCTNPLEAKRYIEFLKQHMKLSCQFQQEKVYSIAEKIARNFYYPIQECLDIAIQHEQIDAAFVLSKKLGRYFESVEQGLKLIQEKVDLYKLKMEIYFAQKNNIYTKYPVTNPEILPTCTQLDHFLKKIVKICQKHCKDVEKVKEDKMWYIVIDALIDMRQNELVSNKLFCQNFFQERLNLFIENLIRVIPIKSFLEYIFDKTYDVSFKDLRCIIKDVFYQMGQEYQVLQNANTSIFKVNTQLLLECSTANKRGINFRSRICGTCKQYMDSFLYDDIAENEDQFSFLGQFDDDSEDEPYIYDSAKEPIMIFACRHTFHVRCLEKYYKRKYGQKLDLMLQRKGEKLKCPTCNLKDYDLTNALSDKTPKIFSKRQDLDSGFGQLLNKGKTVLRIQEKEEKEVDFQQQLEKKQHRREVKMTMVAQNAFSKQIQRLSKKMNFYETSKTNAWLNLDDFKI